MRNFYYSLFILISFLSSCGSNQPNLKESAYTSAINNSRIEKDKYLLTNGIIEDEYLDEFKGLNYFNADSSYLIKTKIEWVPLQKIQLNTNTSELMDYHLFCKLHFSIHDTDVLLEAYAFDSANIHSLFIPFKDKTSGKSSYGGGRFIEMPYSGQKDSLILDFNLAFNPYCHYSHDYTCPMVPIQNTIPVHIFAGEKKLHD